MVSVADCEILEIADDGSACPVCHFTEFQFYYSTMAGQHRTTAAAEQKIAAKTCSNTATPINFYWNRPLGAPTGTFRLTVSLARQQKQKQKQKGQAPLPWSLAYTTVDDLVIAILASVSVTVTSIELVGPAEAYEALAMNHTGTRGSWNKIRDALVTVLHRCRDDNSNSNSSSTNLIQSLQFASGVTNQQTASLLASTLKKRGPSKFVHREVEHPKYSVRIHYASQQSSSSSSSSSLSSPLLTDTLQQLWIGRDQLRELHLHLEGDGGGGSGAYPYPYAVTVKDATLLAEILPHLHTVALHRVAFTCPAAWNFVFASLEESSFLEHLHLDVTVLNNNDNDNHNKINININRKSESRNDSQVSTTAATTTTPDQMATLQAYLDWHVRLNTVRRCLVERDCQVQSLQSKSTKSRRVLVYQQQQQKQQQQQQLSLSDDGSPQAMVTAMIHVEALATETAAVMDAAVVVLKDWWRYTHRPDLPQYQYNIPRTETGGVYPPTATGIDKNGAADSQRTTGMGPASLQQGVASNVVN